MAGDEVEVTFLRQEVSLRLTHYRGRISVADFGGRGCDRKMRWVRSERAKKLGAILEISCRREDPVLGIWGIESATVDRLMTRDTVAGDSARWLCQLFQARIGLRPAAAPVASLPALVFLVVTMRSSRHNEIKRGKARFWGFLVSAIDIGWKSVFHTDRSAY